MPTVKPKLEAYREPLRVTIEKAKNGYILTKGYGDSPIVETNILNALNTVKKMLEKGK